MTCRRWSARRTQSPRPPAPAGTGDRAPTSGRRSARKRASARSRPDPAPRRSLGRLDRFLHLRMPAVKPLLLGDGEDVRSEEHTSELQSLMRISYAVFCLKKKKTKRKQQQLK